MIVGESGLGKSTFINSLFQTDIYNRSLKIVEPSLNNNYFVENITYELKENGMKMLLTVADSPGFGDKFNRSKDLESIIRYIDNQYENYFEKENRVHNRKPIHDTRIHLCFYFINPTGHNLKELDILTLKELSSRVNLIPLIAKADSLTDPEKVKFKKMILEDFKKYNISVYPLDYAGSDYPNEMHERIPFCIIGSDELINVNGQQIRGRQYPWGIVEVENPKHSDFIYLRKMLMEHLLTDLQEWTHHKHYHGYRTKKLLKNNPCRPKSLLPCDDDYDERVKGLKSTLLYDLSRKEEKIQRQLIDNIWKSENRFRQWEEEINKKREQLNEELEKQRLLLEQTRLQLKQEESYRQQW
ncbi:unnamed protein product [Cunninghamella echinulata]